MTAAAVRVLPVPVAISNRKRSLPSFTARCKAWIAWSLVGAQEAEIVGAAEASPLSLILPSRLISIAGPLGKDDVVVPNELVYQTLRVGLDLAVAGYRIRCWECADDVRVAPFQVPEIVQVTI